MTELTKIKKEYSADDEKFPINGEYVKLLIKNAGLTYDQVGTPAGIKGNAIGAWIRNLSLAPRDKVLKAFGQLGITESNLNVVVLTHPSEEIRKQMQDKLDKARESYYQSQKNKNNSDLDIKDLTDQIINLTQVINQISQNQKVFFANWKQLFEQLSKYSDEQAKQQNYLVSEIKSLRKEVQQKNVLIRELQR